MSTFTDTLAGYREDEHFEAEYAHADGSVTFVLRDPHYGGDFNPREDGDCHVASLVRVRDGYGGIDVDPADSGIDEVRDAPYVERHKVDWTFTLDDHAGAVWSFPGTYCDNDYYLDDDDADAWAVLAYFMGWDAEQTVREYVARERSDIAHYTEWHMSGYVQGDWAEGYAYVLHSDLERVGMPVEHCAEAVESEVREYEAWGRGDVYSAVNVHPTEPEYAIGDHGGYYTGEMECEIEDCHGFIVIEWDHKWVAEDMGGPLAKEGAPA